MRYTPLESGCRQHRPALEPDGGVIECGMPLEVERAYILYDDEGKVVHMRKVRCLLGHLYDEEAAE